MIACHQSLGQSGFLAVSRPIGGLAANRHSGWIVGILDTESRAGRARALGRLPRGAWFKSNLQPTIREIMGVDYRGASAVTIQEYCDVLRGARINSVDPYQKRLEDNAPVLANLEDLVCEGRVALTFAQHGCQVTMRESPRLEARIGGLFFGIEVKHFRMEASGMIPWKRRCLNPIRSSLVGCQISAKPKEEKKRGTRCIGSRSSIRVNFSMENTIFCSSGLRPWRMGTPPFFHGCEHVRGGASSPFLRSADAESQNAMMMNGVWSRVGYNGGSVFWRSIWSAKKPPTRELHYLLENIVQPPDAAFVPVTL